MLKRAFCSSFFLFLLPVLFLNYGMPNTTVFFQIEPGSKLYIKGTSNVTDFTCKCEELFPRLQMTIIPKSAKAAFEKTTLSIGAKKLDCGNKAMNKDMYETLKADDFPTIQIALLESEARNLGEDWINLSVSANITIAGITRQEKFSVQARRAEELQYRFKASKTLKMTDYGMTPPRPMFGLIKVKDEIILELDLNISVLEKI